MNAPRFTAQEAYKYHTTMSAGTWIACAACGRSLGREEFSKRQLSPAIAWSAKKCRGCVAASESAERAMAGQTTAVQNNSDDSKHGCSGCGMLLPASRFSRTQLLQKRDAARCLQCVSGEAPSTSEEPILALASPLPAGISAPPITAARPLLEIARLRALKNLRQLLNSLCAKANAEPPVMAFDRWIARSQLPLPDPDAAGDAREKVACLPRALLRSSILNRARGQGW